MAKLTSMTGVNTVLKNLRKATVGFEGRAERGLKLGGLFLQRESQKVVPVDTSNLRGGAETRNVGGKGFATDIIVLYKAIYAVFVHENLDARHKSGKQAKFLEEPARRYLGEILKIIAETK